MLSTNISRLYCLLRSLLICIICFLSLFASSQDIFETMQKASILLKEKLVKAGPMQVTSFIVSVKERKAFLKYLEDKKIDYRIIKEYQPANILVIEAKYGDVNKYILT